MRRPDEKVCDVATVPVSPRPGALVLLAALLLGPPPASALPPATGSKCSSDWVNNPDAMACFIQGEEDLRNGVAHPHYVACLPNGDVFCCVDNAAGQDCEAVKETGVHGHRDIDSLRVQGVLEAQQSIATILGTLSARIDALASQLAGARKGGDCGTDTAEVHGPQVGGADFAALDLTDEQRGTIEKIRQDLHRTQRDLMARIEYELARRRDAPDDATADKIDERIDQLRRQMMGNETAARKQAEAVLTPEQRRQLRRGKP